MQFMKKYWSITAFALTLNLCIAPWAQAHLMVAQRGTLNIVDAGAFMVLSLPLSSFKDVDEDNDGEVSMLEFNNHRATIIKKIRKNVRLSDSNGNRPLQEIMLSPVISHDAPQQTPSQLTVMGKFTLDDGDSALHFHVGLYGTLTAEQSLEITATRQSDNRKHVFELTPKSQVGVLFPEDVYSPD